MEIEVNRFQTPIDDSLFEGLDDEIKEQFLECIETIPFIKNLISPNRRYAKDMPKDESGRIIVDLENPHILEDMDYFRQPAIHYMKHGCYTFLKPNSNPHSEYRKFWDEEIKRCRNGYMRDSDGEWITGLNYWFLNYNPMMINKVVKGSKSAIRIESFPYNFEGIYWRFHYLDKARKNGKHAIELAKRGAHPDNSKVITPTGVKTWKEIKVGDYLFGTYGNITKVIDIPYKGETNVYELTLADGRKVQASGEHQWSVLTSSKRTPKIKTTYEMFSDSFFKGKRGLYKYALPEILAVEYKDKNVPIDAYTLGVLLGDGTFRHTSIELTSSSEDIKEYVNNIPYNITKCDNSKLHYIIHIPKWTSIIKNLGLYKTLSNNKFIPEIYKYNSKEIRLAILQGLFDTDGWCCNNRSPQMCTISEQLKNDVLEIAHSLGYKTHCCKKQSYYKKNNIKVECSVCYTITICGGEELFRLQRKKTVAKSILRKESNYTTINSIELIGTKSCHCVTVDAEDGSYLIGEYIPTHNCAKSYTLSSIMTHNLILGENAEVTKRVMTVLAAYQKEYLKDDKDGTFSKFRPALNFIASNTPFPRLMLKNSPNEMSWQMGYKDEFGVDKGSFNTVMGVAIKDDEGKLRGKRGTFLFEEMGNMPNLLTVYDITRKSVEDGNFTFGQIYLVGTASESESDFSSAKTLLYNSDGYNIYTIKNVFDKPKQGKSNFGFFFPSYINRAGCYNKDGVSDVVKALIEILTARYKSKYSADPQSVLRVIAEDPITPAEAIIKVKAAYFPVTALTERLSQLDTDSRAFDDVYVGDLIQNGTNVEFRPTNDVPIRKYGVDNSTPGAIEIYEMPCRNSQGEVFNNRYIVGHDPVDNDQADSSSLSSTFVFDLFTDKIVAEYTGRKQFADDNFEIARLLCLYYNAKMMAEANKKGWYAYFAKMNCTHLLAETPEYLREKQLVKYSAFGSNKYGINATAAINNYANSLIKDWLCKPTEYIVKKEDGTEERFESMMLYSIRSRALLEELIAFRPELNVDRIRSLGMVMLAREEKIIQYQGIFDEETAERHMKEDLSNDEFFTKNYDDRYEEY